MDLRDKILRHRKDSRFVVGGLGLLLVVLTGLYSLVLRGRDLPPALLTNRVLLFVLWYINVVLILTVVFILVRTVFRLLLERRHRILGSKFKTKLVLTAIGLSLIPVLILFPFATRLLLDSFDRWFTLPVKEVVEGAADTAQALSHEIERTCLRDAARVLTLVAPIDLRDLDARPLLQRRLEELRQELELDALAVYDGTEFIHATADPRSIRSYPDLRRPGRFLQEAIDRGEAVQVGDYLGVEGRLILVARAAKPEAEGTAADGARSRTVVVAGAVLPPDLAEKSAGLLKAYQDYLQVEVQRDSLQATYLLALLMVTLLVILAFSSIGLRLARRVTAPIQALADGARRIGSGDLDHRVQVAVDDELGVLVDAFNHMTGELQRNKQLVDRSNQELMAANKRITEERLLLATVLQNVAAGVVAIDATGKILTSNGAALRILNQSEDEVAGRDLHQAWSDPERRKLVRLLEESPGHASGSQLRLTLGGVWKTLDVQVTTLPDAGGGPGGRVVVLEDLTELIQAQKMATWNEVARRIAHEIKNPLTPIKLTAERLLRKHRQADPTLGETLEEGVEVIVREVSSLKSMVDEFSRYARMPRPHPQQVDLDRLVGETVGLYEGLKPGVRVESRVAAAAAKAWFDPDQLKSVLINLLDNAVEATPAPGTVTVSTVPDNGSVLLRVADTGCGIRPEDREKLFLPYFSTKGRGTGLGLAIVHRIVHDHHTSLRVEDNRPQGTVFTLELPSE